MWIRTQTGKTILNSANITYIYISNGVINARDISCVNTTLGIYDDDKNAHAVLTKLLNAKAAHFTAFDMPDKDYKPSADTNMHEDLKRDVVNAIQVLKYYFPDDNIDIHIPPTEPAKIDEIFNSEE